MQVSLGVLLKSETSYEDMTEILEHYQTYVPSVPCEKSIPESGTTPDKCFLTTLVGGDYLSVARARGAQLICSTSELKEHTLDGFLPVAEDWHAKVCFMEVQLKSRAVVNHINYVILFVGTCDNSVVAFLLTLLQVLLKVASNNKERDS